MNNKMKLQFLVYLIKLAYPKYNAHHFIIYMLVNYWNIIKQQQVYTLHSVSSKFLKNFIREYVVWDIDNTVVINDTVDENSQKFIIVTLKNDVLNRRVYVVRKHFANDFVALVSHNLLHNLKNVTTCTFKKCDEKSLKYADEIDLSLINSTSEWSHFVVDLCLKNYFRKPKLLYKGDIMRVSLEEFGKEYFYSANKVSNINENLYFVCNKITYMGRNVGNRCLCVIDKCTVKQSTNLQSFIPKSQDIADNTLHAYPLVPNAFDTYFENLKKAVLPFSANNRKNFLPIFLLEGRKGSGKSLLVQCLASVLGMHLYTVNNFEITANVYAQNETKLRNIFFGAKMVAPTILEIKNFENVGKNNEGVYDERLIDHFINELKSLFDGSCFPVILFCVSNEKNIPIDLKRIFLKTFEIKAPTEEERELILWWVLNTSSIKTSANINNLANKTHGFLFEDLRTLVHYATTEFYREKNNANETEVPEQCFLKALDLMQSNYNQSLGAPKVPQVKWSDVGGLNDVKEEIIKTIKLPLKRPDLFKTSGLKRSGILLFGPPGTGKTLLAKAVATECGLCFLSVKGPELLNMYVGQSEQNVREVFERARDASPCIIFFDELDSLAPNRGGSGDSGGVMDRVVSQLLAEMDGLNQVGTVFIIGATNRPDLIDPALLRPGRFDKLLYVGPCVDRDSKVAVLTALTRKFNLQKNSVVEEVVSFCPENFSGADFYGICSGAWMSAVRRLIMNVENGTMKIENLTLKDVTVRADDFKTAIEKMKPSIKKEDLEYFHKLKSNYK